MGTARRGPGALDDPAFEGGGGAPAFDRADAFDRAAAAEVLHRSRRTLRFEILRFLPGGSARSSSTHCSSYVS
jgi:hypothetical protein